MSADLSMDEYWFKIQILEGTFTGTQMTQTIKFPKYSQFESWVKEINKRPASFKVVQYQRDFNGQ